MSKIERSGPGVTRKNMGDLMIRSSSGRALLRSPENRAALLTTPEGRAAVARYDRAAATMAEIKACAIRGKAGPAAHHEYGPKTDRSFFRDLVAVRFSDQHLERLIAGGYRPTGRDLDEIAGPDGDTATRRARLERDTRSVTSTGGGAGFVGYGYVGSEMDTAARLEGKVGDLVTTVNLPPHGTTVRLPMQTGTTVEAVTAEGGAVTNTVVTSDYQDAPLITLVGSVTVTQQLLDRADGLVDQQIARDLGADLARVLDRQILFGTGSGELTGLLTLAGTTLTTYTDSSPTVAEHRAKVWTMARDIQIASGLDPDVLIMHPTRHSWLQSGTDTASRQLLGIDLPARPVAVGNVPTNQGAGANQDRTMAWRKDRVVLHRSPVAFRVMPDTSDGANLAVRIDAYCYAALVVTRPSAVGFMSGTGCITPSI